MVNKGNYLEFVKTLDKELEYSTTMSIIIEMAEKIVELENKIKELK